MIGILIAAVVALWSYFMSHLSIEAAFLASMNVLWVVQLVLTGITAVFIILVLLGITGGFTAAGGLGSGSVFGGLAGFAVGGFMSFILLAGFAVTRGMLLGGTWLLLHSGTSDMTFAQFDQTKLILGGILLVLGVLFSKASASHSSSRSETYA